MSSEQGAESREQSGVSRVESDEPEGVNGGECYRRLEQIVVSCLSVGCDGSPLRCRTRRWPSGLGLGKARALVECRDARVPPPPASS